MSGIKTKDIDNRRRHLLFGGLALGATGFLQACGGGGADSGTESGAAQTTAGTTSQSTLLADSAIGVTTPAPIPANVVNLSDFGGIPGASGSAITSAFGQAFSKLKSLGGGTLKVASGVYGLGSFSGGIAIPVSDLQNVLISAYGAQLTMTTSAVGTPSFFQFNNPNNVTVAGLSFKDFGTDLNINWRGAHCLVINTTRACSGFKTVDCVADNVVAFLSAQQPSSYQYTFQGFDIHATVRNTYYGVNPNFNGSNSKANLTTHNVRRAFIGYGLRNWDVTVNASADGTAPGSNALIELAADNRGYVDTVRVNLTVTGNMRNYNGLVTCFHQSSSSFRQYIRNVKANVTLNNVTSASDTVFFFPYWDPNTQSIMGSTISVWEQIQIAATVVGSYSGTMIKNPSVSSGTTNAIYVGSGLAARQNMTVLPKYFQVITQCSA